MNIELSATRYFLFLLLNLDVLGLYKVVSQGEEDKDKSKTTLIF